MSSMTVPLAATGVHGSLRGMRTALLFLFSAMALSCGEVHLTCDSSDGRPAHQVLGALLTLDPSLGDLHTDLLVAGRGEVPVTMALVEASTSGARQAMAHATGTWWTENAAGRILFITDPKLSIDRLATRTHTSTLADAAWSEPVVASLMAPWLAGDTGVSYEPMDGTWTATLDQTGHGILDVVLSTLEGRAAAIPPLVPDPRTPDPDRPLQALRAATWGEAARLLAAQGLSCSISPALIQEGLPDRRLDLPAGRVSDLPRQFARIGVQAAFIHGVLCCSGLAEPVEDRRHPAQRRRLAMIPLRHLVRDANEGLVLATALRERVMPWCWSRPGNGLWFLDRRGTLLVAADLTVIHAVLDALALVDRQGLEAGLRRLAP